MADGPGKVRSIAEVVTAEAAACEQVAHARAARRRRDVGTGPVAAHEPGRGGRRRAAFRDMIETWIAMAALDGSFGWTGLANFSSTAASAAYLPDAGFAEVFGGATRA